MKRLPFDAYNEIYLMVELNTSAENLIAQASALIQEAAGKELQEEVRVERAIQLAALLQEAANLAITSKEEKIQEELAGMMMDRHGKAFITAVADQCFRSQSLLRTADQIRFNIHKFGIPRFLKGYKRLGLSLFNYLGKGSFLIVPALKAAIRRESSSVIMPGEGYSLRRHIAKRRQEGVRINLNRLGEAILGEQEAAKRINLYLRDLADPAIEYISVKVSTLCSQLNLIAWEDTLDMLTERLSLLYRQAERHLFLLPNGKKRPKFVNLDMEEYRDLHLTVEAFCRVLSQPEFFYHSAGIVLQSYLPDSFEIQKRLTEWAKRRVNQGGAPIKIRIVKGANLAMEQVEASLRDWPQAPYLEKNEVDANFKRMLDYGCKRENAFAVHLGIGSHNLFNIAYALLLRAENGVEEAVALEMLEGMAAATCRMVFAVAHAMLLYCPAATKSEFQNAMAYLLRRLDENTAEQNFLRVAFHLKVNSQEWNEQAHLFKTASLSEQPSLSPRRTQDRHLPFSLNVTAPFCNEADTDWSLAQNRQWALELMQSWKQRIFPKIPLVIDGNERLTEKQKEARDPSEPQQILYKYSLASFSDIDQALQCAKMAFQSWSKSSTQERSLLLAKVALELRNNRKELIGAMIADTAKSIPEADSEVSEAIDFAEYYRRNSEELDLLKDIQWSAKGVVLVAPPWNFPCSIPAGGILAALATGNCVLFKPAPEAILVGWQLVKLFWQAGVSKKVLQFIVCEDDPEGSKLVQDSRLDAVILTGGTETAKHLMKLRPGLDLMAETGGKNAMIITALADRDLAIKDLVQSAFGHAGQKCSACSLAICEAEVYDDPHFRRHLKDAAESWRVGSAWDPASRLTPLIRNANPTLLRGLTTLEPGEEWLLEPMQGGNPQLWSPGIKLGVKKGSFTYQHELFGPVLGIMRANNLDHAIELANGTPYGLTAGLHSLDEREQDHWKKQIVAGNLYINRGITGAIVQRQPFGGTKDSGFGPGAKAGGPNYLIQLMHANQKEMPEHLVSPENFPAFLKKIDFSDREEMAAWQASVGSYLFFWREYFSKKHDPSRVLGEDNFLSYVPHASVVIRMTKKDSWLDARRSIAAAMICNANFEVSVDGLDPSRLGFECKTIVETEQAFVERIVKEKIKRVRFLGIPSEDLTQAMAQAFAFAMTMPVLCNGRLELLHYLREVSLSSVYHRYGYLGLRESEQRGYIQCKGCRCSKGKCCRA